LEKLFTAMTQIKSQRYVALDVLRGMTVAGMILVNNPGSWGHIFPPLAHAKWAGCTPTDLVFPFFLFVVGAAMAFSFAKYNEGLSGASVKKLVKRGILIFLV
jgi:predicted acyltransferase